MTKRVFLDLKIPKIRPKTIKSQKHEKWPKIVFFQKTCFWSKSDFLNFGVFTPSYIRVILGPFKPQKHQNHQKTPFPCRGRKGDFGKPRLLHFGPKNVILGLKCVFLYNASKWPFWTFSKTPKTPKYHLHYPNISLIYKHQNT